MKNKKYTIYLLGGDGSTIKQKSFSRRAFLTFMGVLGLSFFSLIWVILGFIYNINPLSLSLILQQKREIQSQKAQIQLAAVQINSLKENLKRLSEFDQRIRIVADIGTNEESGILGVGGGSSLEDIDINLNAKENHKAILREVKEQTKQLEEAVVSQEDSFESLLVNLQDKKQELASTPAVRPAKGWLTSGFGYRVSPFTGEKDFHNGLDIANITGTKVISTGNGVVSYVGFNGALGLCIKIDHSRGYTTVYGHLDKVLIQKGAMVKRGTEIAKLGNSGRSTGPHLHYEVHQNGIPLDPKKFILN